MRHLLIGLWMLCGSVTAALAQVSVGIGLPGVSIGINLPVYPELVRVPDYPVYYAPRVGSNYFFYDGMYWVYQGDNWYASRWYNGPWGAVSPQVVPVYVLRVPVRYYRVPPPHFHGWRADAPPRWGDHWGKDWDRQHKDWDKWDRRSAPPPAPLPVYQRQYSGERYPRQIEQQHTLHQQNYRYEPKEPAVRQHYQEQQARKGPAPDQREKSAAPQDKSARPQDDQRSGSPPKAGKGGDGSKPDQKQQPHPASAQGDQQAPDSSQGRAKQDKGSSDQGQGQAKGQGQGQAQPQAQGQGQKQGQGKDRDKGDPKGQEGKQQP